MQHIRAMQGSRMTSRARACLIRVVQAKQDLFCVLGRLEHHVENLAPVAGEHWLCDGGVLRPTTDRGRARGGGRLCGILWSQLLCCHGCREQRHRRRWSRCCCRCCTASATASAVAGPGLCRARTHGAAELHLIVKVSQEILVLLRSIGTGRAHPEGRACGAGSTHPLRAAADG